MENAINCTKVATQEELQDSTRKNYDELMGLWRPELTHLYEEAERLGRSPLEFGATQEDLEYLHVIGAKFSEIVTPYSACHGCSHCCHMAVMLTNSEARIISERDGFPMNEKAGVTFSPAPGETAVDADLRVMDYTTEKVNSFRGVECPFLVDGKCAIYSNRPMACRVYHNLSGYQANCDISKGNNQVPSLDLGLFTQALIGVTYSLEDDPRVGDIRDFFQADIDKP